MAGYTDQQLFAVVQPQLQPGEVVATAAYAERGMPWWGRLICMLLMIPWVIPGVVVFVAWSLFGTQNFVIALTNQRLIVVRVSGLTPKNAFEYPLPLQGRALMSHVGQGLSRGYLLEIAGDRPFNARFLNSSPSNITNAANLARALVLPGPAPRG